MADSYEELLDRLSELFSLLIKNGIRLNLSKCELVKKEIKFLGHVVNEKGLRPDVKNVEAVMKMNPPKNVREVRRFLGVCGFYRKFIPGYSLVALPITSLTKKKVKFEWSDKC